MSAAVALLGSVVLLAGVWFVHTRVRGFLPDDHPGPARKAHGRPIPMVGFVLGLASTGVLLWFETWWIAGASAIACATGTLDDYLKHGGRDGLNWKWKLVGLVIAAAGVVHGSGLADNLCWRDTFLLGGLVFIATNAFNFLDNQNGVCATLGVVALAVLGRGDVEALPTILAALWLGFLPFNWPGAKMFLGDSGAYALGIQATALSLAAAVGLAAAPGLAGAPSLAGVTAAGAPWIAIAIPIAVPLIDFTQVVAARLYLGRAPWVGDRRHVTHILLNGGVPKWLLAPLLGGVAAGIGLLPA